MQLSYLLVLIYPVRAPVDALGRATPPTMVAGNNLRPSPPVLAQFLSVLSFFPDVL